MSEASKQTNTKNKVSTMENFENTEFTQSEMVRAIAEVGGFGLSWKVEGKWKFWMRLAVDGYITKNRKFSGNDIEEMLKVWSNEQWIEPVKKHLAEQRETKKSIEEIRNSPEYQAKIITINN